MKNINRRDVLKGLVVSAAAIPASKVLGDITPKPIIVDESSHLKPIRADRVRMEPIIADSELVLDLNECLDYDITQSRERPISIKGGSGTMDLSSLRFIETGSFIRVSIYAPMASSELYDAITNYKDVRVIHRVNDEVIVDGKMHISEISMGSQGADSEIIMDLSGKLI